MNRRILLIIAVFASAALTARANLVANPGFENGVFAPWTQWGDPGFSGVFNMNQHSGNYAAQFGELPTDGGIDQFIPTLAATPYILDFWLRNDDASHNNAFGVTFGGVTVVPEAPQLLHSYLEYTFTVIPGANADLHFIFRNPSSFFFLDDVSVNAVPEPGTLGLVALGALGLVGAVRKRLLV